MSLVLRFTLSLLILAAPTWLEAQARPLQLDDLGMLKGVSEPQLSPDGRWIAYQVRTTDYDADVVTGEIDQTHGTSRCAHIDRQAYLTVRRVLGLYADDLGDSPVVTIDYCDRHVLTFLP